MYGSAILRFRPVPVILPVTEASKLYPAVTVACGLVLYSAEKDCQHHKREAVVRAISSQWPPRQVKNILQRNMKILRPQVGQRKARSGKMFTFETTAHVPMTNSTLKTADPTMVPNPTELCANVPMNEVNSSGAEPPAAISVAPAISGSISHLLTITSRAVRARAESNLAPTAAAQWSDSWRMVALPGTKNSSHTTDNDTNISRTPNTYTPIKGPFRVFQDTMLAPSQSASL